MAMDYLNYWGLTRKPFIGECSDEGTSSFFFSASAQREAIAGISYFIASAWNSALLVAPRGHGTTTLLERLSRMRGFGDCAVDVFRTSDHAADMSATMGAIQRSTQRGVRTVWLIDDCDVGAARRARDLIMAGGDVCVLMATTERRKSKLECEFGKCCLRIDLDPIGVSDAIRFTADAIRHAGTEQAVFDDASSVRLHEVCEGRIAEMANLAEAALKLAAFHGADQVSASVIEAAMETSTRNRRYAG